MKKATGQNIRTHNLALILKTIFTGNNISRAEVARLTGLTRATVSDAVSRLMRDGLVEETGLGKSAGGKRPIMLRVAEDSRSLIGIDLSDNEFTGALVNLRGKIKRRFSVSASGASGSLALDRIYELVGQLVAAAESPILGIGIGTPGLIDVGRGVVIRAANLDWYDVPLAERLKSRFHLPVCISNDCRAAALGEFTFGNGVDEANLVVIKICLGTGAGIVINRQLFYGDGFGAGEIGHLTVVEDGEPCPCGKKGCLETVTCSRHIVNRAREIALGDPESSLHALAGRGNGITIDDVVRAHETGDLEVGWLVSEAGRYLGMVAANFVNVLNIERIVIAGSVARFGEPLLEAIRREVGQRSLSLLGQGTAIVASSLGSDIVILGAAALLMNDGLLLP